MAQTKSRCRQFIDEQWERIEPLLPSDEGRQGHPLLDNRTVVEGIHFRYRAGVPWRHRPREEFGPWQTVWKRHARYARDDTWDWILQEIPADPHPAGMIDWVVPADATICRVHQHSTNTTRPEQHTGGHAQITRIGP